MPPITTDRGWADDLPPDASAQDKSEAAEMSPAIREALNRADLKAIRHKDGTWTIIRKRRTAHPPDHERGEAPYTGG